MRKKSAVAIVLFLFLFLFLTAAISGAVLAQIPLEAISASAREMWNSIVLFFIVLVIAVVAVGIVVIYALLKSINHLKRKERDVSRARLYCGSCGKENPADAQFCTNCGKPLNKRAS